MVDTIQALHLRLKIIQDYIKENEEEHLRLINREIMTKNEIRSYEPKKTYPKIKTRDASKDWHGCNCSHCR